MNTYQNFLNLAEWANRSGDTWLHARAIASLVNMDKAMPVKGNPNCMYGNYPIDDAYKATVKRDNERRKACKEKLLSGGTYPDWPENVLDPAYRQVGNYEDKIKERGYFTFDEVSEFTPEQFDYLRKRILGDQTPPIS